MDARPVSRGFSLVELVIVVAIIATIAGMAVPRYQFAVAGAEDNALRGQLATLRTAIDGYVAEHDGVFPGLNAKEGKFDDGKEEDFHAQLTSYSNRNGRTGAFAPDADPPVIFGPYLLGVPELRVRDLSESSVAEVHFDKDVPLEPDNKKKVGWLYNAESGQIIANAEGQDSAGRPFSTY